MKKIILIILTSLIVSSAYAQDKATENKSESKTLEFLSQGSSLIQKEFYNVGSVKGVKCEVLIVTNLLRNTKMGCLRLETKYSGYSTSDTYIGTLDYDEIDDCISSLSYIREKVLPSTPMVYTEVTYNTRDKIKVGAYYDSKKVAWIAYVYTKSYTSRSAEFFDAQSLQNLADMMTQAKSIIAEKVQ